MKRLFIGLTLVVAAFGAPLVEDADLTNIIDDEGTVSAANFTASVAANRAVGWGSFGAGTTGGQGGSEFTVWDAFALRDALNSNANRIVTVRGRIDLTPLFVNSPGVRLFVGSYTTIRGGDRNAEITGGGLSVSNVQQVIISNMKIFNALSYAPGESPNGNGGIANLGTSDFSSIDNIEISTSSHVWVDHCEFSDQPWNPSSRPRRHDGLVDIVRGSDFITVSNNIFSTHVRVSLVGNGDNNGHIDDGKLRITYFGNWFRGVSSRNPRVRFGRVHVLNNLYTDIGNVGVGIGVSARVFVERNVFRNCRRAWGYPVETDPLPNPPGHLYDLRNSLINSPRDTTIPNDVGWNPWGTYEYRAIAIGEVENYVRNNAGVL